MIKSTERIKRIQEKAGIALKKSIREDKETSRQEKKRCRSIKEQEQDPVEYERLSVQKVTSKKISKLIYRSIYH